MINTITDQVKKVFGDVYITTLVPTEIKQELHLCIIFFFTYDNTILLERVDIVRKCTFLIILSIVDRSPTF